MLRVEIMFFLSLSASIYSLSSMLLQTADKFECNTNRLMNMIHHKNSSLFCTTFDPCKNNAMAWDNLQGLNQEYDILEYDSSNTLNSTGAGQ